MKEAELQTKVKKMLEAAGWLVVKLIQTSANGMTDLMALRNGRAIFLEIKMQGKKARPLQEYRLNQLIKQGFTAKVIDQIEQIYEFTSLS